jgi:hypothetical protein
MANARINSDRSLRVCSMARGVLLFDTQLLPEAVKNGGSLNSISQFATCRHKNILEIGEHKSHINV